MENALWTLGTLAHSGSYSNGASSQKIHLKTEQLWTCAATKPQRSWMGLRTTFIRYLTQFICHHHCFYHMMLLDKANRTQDKRPHAEYLVGVAQVRQVHPKGLPTWTVDSSQLAVLLRTSAAWLPCSVLHSLSAKSWFMVSGSSQECSHWKLRTIFTLDQTQPLCSIKNF